MRSFESRLANCAGVGFVAAVAMFGFTAHANDYNPAHIQQEQVDDCAAQLSTQPQPNQKTLPPQCELFVDSMYQSDGVTVTYNLPAQRDFIEKNWPGKHYNRDHYLAWAAAALFWGGAITAGSYIVAREFGPTADADGNPKPEPKPAEQIPEPALVGRRRQGDGTPAAAPDDLEDWQLHELAMATSPEYRTVQAFKVTRRQLAELPTTPEL